MTPSRIPAPPPPRDPAESSRRAHAARTASGTTPVAEAPAPRRDPLRLAVQLSPLLGLVASIGLLGWGVHAGILSSVEDLRHFIDSLGIFGPVVFMLVTAAAVVFPILPGGLMAIAGPVLFGPVEGLLLTYIAVCAGLQVNFAIGRHVGMPLIERMFRPATVEKILGWTRNSRFTAAFAVTLALPIAPDDAMCYVAGTTRMRWKTFLITVLVCKPLSLIAFGLGVSTLLLRFLPW